MEQTTMGEFIKNKREEKGYSQRKLSLLTGISNSTISRIESGDNYPSIDTLEKIALHLNLSYQELMNHVGNTHSSNNNIIIVDDTNLSDIVQMIKGKKIRIVIEIID